MLLPTILLLASVSDAPDYVDSSLALDGRLLAWRLVDVDMDGRNELVTAVLSPDGRRTLRVHRLQKDRVDPVPERTIAVPRDVIGWRFDDFEPRRAGRELLLLTPEGAALHRPAADGRPARRDTICSAPLLFDAPDPDALKEWEYVLPQPDGGVHLLLPTRSSLLLLGPPQGADDKLWRTEGEITATPPDASPDPEDSGRRARDSRRSRERQMTRLGDTLETRLRPFLSAESRASVVDDEFSIQSPALVDANGDGHTDLLLLTGTSVQVHLGGQDGIPAAPTRVEALPSYLTIDRRAAALRLVDVDRDGTLDVIGVWSESVGTFENGDWRIFVLRSTKGRLLPEKPDLVLRFEAADLRTVIHDIDGDGRIDLAVRGLELPGLVASVTGIEFEHFHALFVGKEGGGFERRPTLRHRTKIDADEVAVILKTRDLSLDMTGDGIADLVELGLNGEIAIRSLRRESSFFGGLSWKLDDEPTRTLETESPVSSLDVVDLNGDGLGDIVGRSPGALTILISRAK